MYYLFPYSKDALNGDISCLGFDKPRPVNRMDKDVSYVTSITGNSKQISAFDPCIPLHMYDKCRYASYDILYIPLKSGNTSLNLRCKLRDVSYVITLSNFGLKLQLQL